MPVIELTTIIRAPIGRCFDLSRSIELHTLSTHGTDERAVAGVMSGLLGFKERVTWRARHFGVTQRLTSEITQFERPYHFRDEMIKGIFRMIRHDHEFRESEGVTTMTDRFEFESPAWVLGQLFNVLVLTRYLRVFLEKRNQCIREVAESDQWKTILIDRI